MIETVLSRAFNQNGLFACLIEYRIIQEFCYWSRTALVIWQAILHLYGFYWKIVDHFGEIMLDVKQKKKKIAGLKE